MYMDLARDDESDGSEGDVPLIAAKRLDHERLVANKMVRDFLEDQGERELHYSLQIPELLPGGITISRVIALTENSFYKFSQSALTTGNFHNARHAVVDLQHVLIKDDAADLHLEMQWSNRDVGVSKFTLRFREAQQKRAFLLALCNVLPDVSIYYKDARGEPVRPANIMRGDLYGSPGPAASPLALGSRLDLGATNGSGAVDDDIDSPLGTPPRRPLLPKPKLPDTDTGDTAANAELTGDITGDELKYMVSVLCPPPATPGRNARSLTASTDPQDRTLFVSPAPRQVSIVSHDGRSRTTVDDERYSTGTGHDHLSALFQQAVVDEYAHLQVGDYVEVRDEDEEPWKDGWVHSISGDPLVIPLPENPNFFVLANPSTQLKVQPEGTDKAFFWRQLRVPREAELQLRRKEREDALERARKLREEEEEKVRIRKMIVGMERRLEQELRDAAQERLEAQQRVLSRQRADDPRFSLTGYVPPPSQMSPGGSRCLSPPATARGGDVPGTPEPSPFSNPGLYGSPSPRVTVPTPFRFGTSVRQASVGVTHFSPSAGVAGGPPRESVSPGMPCPDDRMLLGRDMYDAYTRWRNTGGLAEGRSDEWTIADSRALVKGLKHLHADLVRVAAVPLAIDRVARIIGMLERERKMIVNRQKSVPLDGAPRESSLKATVPVPFRLSAGTKPPILMSTQEVKQQLKEVTLASERAIDRLRRGYSDHQRSVQRGVYPPALPSPSPRRGTPRAGIAPPGSPRLDAPPPSVTSAGEHFRTRQASHASAARSSRRASEAHPNPYATASTGVGPDASFAEDDHDYGNDDAPYVSGSVGDGDPSAHPTPHASNHTHASDAAAAAAVAGGAMGSAGTGTAGGGAPASRSVSDAAAGGSPGVSGAEDSAPAVSASQPTSQGAGGSGGEAVE